ncbi:Glutamate receptor 3.6 [Chlorella vulgaris]
MKGALRLLLSPAALLLILLPPGSAQPALNLPQTAADNATAGQPKLVICIADWSPVPIAICTNATSTAPASFSGHDVEMIRIAADRLALIEGQDYDFKCVAFSTLVASLTQVDSVCTAAAAGITITTEREAQGVQFSYPYMKSALGVLVQSNPQSSTGWGFLKPFTWQLWLALLITLICFPPMVFSLEFLSLRKAIHKEDWLPGIRESSWRTAQTLMLFDSINVTSLGARIAVLTFCFLALLTTSTYTANLAAFVTLSSIHIARLEKYGIQGIPYPFNSGSDYLHWRDLVMSGQLTAVVRDLPPLQWLAGNAPRCEVSVLNQEIEPFDYGVAFHQNVSSSVVSQWSSKILEMQEDGTLPDLKAKWIFNPTDGCGVSGGPESVGWSDLWGLWLIAGAGAVCGLFVMVLQRSRRKWKSLRCQDAGSRSQQRQGHKGLTLQGAPRRSKSLVAMGARMLSRKRQVGGGKQAASFAADVPQAQLVATAAQPAGWDLESQKSTGLEESCGSGSVRTVQFEQDSPRQRMAAEAAAPAQGRAGSKPSLQRQSALSHVESIYGARQWKSPPRALSNVREAS